jgi:tRNA uridine 5-carboxymethylaminomethyl modification enzyme
LFIEPEGWDTVEYYVNGFSSSLPEDIQFKALRRIPGFENAKFFRPGYAIEYDYFPPYQLNFSLETKVLENLFLAGQINGTTGYEEAAAQGLMAGINAHLKINEKAEFVLKRSEAYIGVLIDDLITKGTDEPYRMFTSRAEYRILLRQDNADHRLTPLGYKLGLTGEDRMRRLREKYAIVDRIIQFLRTESVSPEEAEALLISNKTALLSQKSKLSNILLRPQVSLADMSRKIEKVGNFLDSLGPDLAEEMDEAEIRIKYEGYIEKEQELAGKMTRLEDIPIPAFFDYTDIKSLSSEAREKLTKVKPGTIGQASRISGVSPSDVSVLIVFLGR